MGPRNLLFISYSLDVGGIETLILEICRKLDRSRFKPFVCSFFEDGRLAREFEKIDVPVLTARKAHGLDWKLAFRLAKLMKDHRIDIVHTHNPSVWLYGGIAARIAGLPLVHTAHSPSEYNVKRWGWIEYALSLITHKIVPVSHYVAEYMVKDEGISKNKIQVIHNGIKVNDFAVSGRESRREDFNLSTEDFVFLCVARLTPIKDHATLIAAFSKVSHANPQAKLLLAGDGPKKIDLQKQVESLNLSGSVLFLGNRRDISRLHQIADVFVLSSIKEGMPLVLIEAMASELPTIATSGGGSAEIVVDGQTGLVVPSQDSDAMARAMSTMIQKPEERRRMGKNGRIRAAEKFTFEKMMDSYYGLYEPLLQK